MQISKNRDMQALGQFLTGGEREREREYDSVMRQRVHDRPATAAAVHFTPGVGRALNLLHMFSRTAVAASDATVIIATSSRIEHRFGATGTRGFVYIIGRMPPYLLRRR